MPVSRYLSTLLASLAVLAGAIFVLWSFSVQGNVPLRKELARLAGPDAADCGLVKLDADRTAAAA
jgi:hypothetical protein